MRWRTVELRVAAVRSSGGLLGAIKRSIWDIHLLYCGYKAKLPTCFIGLNGNPNTKWSSASTIVSSYSNLIHCEGS